MLQLWQSKRLSGSRRCTISAAMTRTQPQSDSPAASPDPGTTGESEAPVAPKKPREIGGPKGPEPTRYGDWEIGGRCIDF
jgi:hypothetical protein